MRLISRLVSLVAADDFEELTDHLARIFEQRNQLVDVTKRRLVPFPQLAPAPPPPPEIPEIPEAASLPPD